MSESNPSPKSVALGGILEGLTDRPEELQRAVAACQQGPFALGDVEIDGARYSITFARERAEGRGVDEAARAHFVEGLQAIVDCSSPGRVAESTLHVAEYFDTQVTESIFYVGPDGVRAESRTRYFDGVAPDGGVDSSNGVPSPWLQRIGAGRATMLIVAIVLIAFAVAWQRGVIDAVLSPDASSVEFRLTALEDCLSGKLEKQWGRYEAKISRGNGFPLTVEAADRWVDAAPNLQSRALREAVVSGGDAYLRLIDENDEILAAHAISLSPLLEDEGVVKASFRGRFGIRRVELAMSSGVPD